MTRRQVWLAVQAVVTVVLLVPLFQRFDWAAFGALLRRMSPAFYAGSLALAFTSILIVAWLVPLDRLLADERWPARAAAWLPRVREIAGIVRTGACRPGSFGVSAAVTLGYALLMALVYLRYFDETGVNPVGLAAVMNIVIGMAIFINLPISVNGIGLREQLHSLLFATLGVPKEVSVSLALLLFSHFMLLSLAGYVVWLRIKPVVAT